MDFDQLKQELSDSIVEGPQERYRLDWPGKREALLAANASKISVEVIEMVTKNCRSLKISI